MADALKIAPELQARIDQLAARAGITPEQVITDALENGASLDWQERFVAKVEAGIAAGPMPVTSPARPRSSGC